MKNRLSAGFTIVLLALSIVLCLGVRFLFHACGATEEGTYMSCHWAQSAVMTAGGTAAVLFAIALIVRNLKMRAGMILAGILVTAEAMLFASNQVIRLCAMKDMRCWAVMRTAVFAIGAVMLIAEAADLAVTLREAKKHGTS